MILVFCNVNSVRSFYPILTSLAFHIICGFCCVNLRSQCPVNLDKANFTVGSETCRLSTHKADSSGF